MRRFSAGDRLADRYLLSALLGEGAVADVWLAEDIETNYQVALKVLRESAATPDAFRAEWQTQRALNHPHIVRVFEFFDAPLHFYAQYFVDGIALSDLGREDWRVVLRPLLLVCRAVAYLHQRDVFHGDLVAGNILIDKGGAPFLIDFGSARRGDVLIGCSSGTPAAMSPERLAGGEPGSADDVYALGILLTEVITGSSGEHARALVGTLNEVPAELARLLESMLGESRTRPDIATVEKTLTGLGIQPGPLPAALVRDYRKGGPVRREDTAVSDEAVAAVVQPAATRKGPATTETRTHRRKGVSPVLVGLSLAVLLAVFVWVVAFLPRQVARTADEVRAVAEGAGGDSGAAEVADQQIADEIEFSEGSYDDSRRTEAVRLKNATDRSLGELLTKQEVLEARAVKRWAAARYESALSRYEEGDRYYIAKDYTAAGAAYRDTIEVFDTLLTEVEDEFLAARAGAQAALDAGNGREAEKLFSLALAITPNDGESLAGLERARRLDDVLVLTDAAFDAESEGDFEAALSGFEKALELDGAWRPAALGRERVMAMITEFRFRSLMTAGFDALNAGRLGDAARAFREAREVMPASSEPLDGLQQVDQASRLGKIDRLTAQANRAEAEEDWDGAVQTYERILKQDANVVVAQEGLDRARSRVALDKQLKKYIADPDSLSEASVMNAAAGLLTRIARISPQGPRLTEQKAQLARLLKRAANPIEVRLISDALTDVALYKVGKLGRFESTALELRPGTYTVVGSRPGYKDVRLQFRVAPEIETGPIVIRCEEPI